MLATACSTTYEAKSGGDQPAMDGSLEKIGLQSGGRPRTYYLYVPPGRSAERLPLVLMLHSGGGNARLFQYRTRMREKADAGSFAVVFPNGTGLMEERFLSWNSGHCCDYALRNKVDDITFLGHVIEDVRGRVPIDGRRIYLAGFSNGGMLAYRYAAMHPGQVAAVAAVSSTMGGRVYDGAPLVGLPDPAMPLPVIMFHGRRDEQIRYDGGHGDKTFGARLDISVDDTAGFWRRNNDCGPASEVGRSESGGIERKSWQCPGMGEGVVLYSVKNGGHSWPGEVLLRWVPELLLLDTPTTEISATDIIWEFFDGFSRDGARVVRRRPQGHVRRGQEP